MFIILNIYRRLRYGIDGNGGDQSCPSLPVRCDPDSKVRTYDGTCNNLQFPEWGAISKPYQRFFRPMYEDGRTSFLVLLPFIFSIVSKVLLFILRVYCIHYYFYELLGISTPRGATYDVNSGYRSRLPNPRKISTVVFQSQGNGTEDNRHTHMLMQFGQLIDHELTSTFKSGKRIL